MNEVILIGRLTRDPEIRYTQSQMAVCNFTLAVDRQGRRNRNSAPDGNEQTADFIRITVFDRQAENCGRYLSKGRQVAVRGRIQTGSYQDKDGKTVYTTDVIANNVEFLGGRSSEQGYGGGGYQSQNYGGQGGYGAQGQGNYGGQSQNYGGQNQNYGNQNGYQNPNPAPQENSQQGSGQQEEGLPAGFQTVDEDDLPF